MRRREPPPVGIDAEVVVSGAPVVDPADGKTDLPDRLYLRIGEVARLTGVEPHVLRYWETEFRALRPRKSRSGQRLYRRQDVQLVLQLKELLWARRYTIAGAQAELSRQRRGEEAPAEPGPDTVEGHEGDDVADGDDLTEARPAHFPMTVPAAPIPRPPPRTLGPSATLGPASAHGAAPADAESARPAMVVGPESVGGTASVAPVPVPLASLAPTPAVVALAPSTPPPPDPQAVAAMAALRQARAELLGLREKIQQRLRNIP